MKSTPKDMTHVDIPLNLDSLEKDSRDLEILKSAASTRATAHQLASEQHFMEAFERIVEALREMRDFSDFENTEFRAMLCALLFDLSEIHFNLKDYKQSEKELDVVFRLLDLLIRQDADRFGHYHILAMELSTRILRSRKKTLEMLLKQQITTGTLYEKVNAGVAAATDKLVDSLRKVGQLLASTGDYRAALKFFAEAIKYSKKRTGRVTRKEVKMTIEMAEIMLRIKSMRPRARRLLNAILPHAIALETIELEEEILAMVEMIDRESEHEPKWKQFMQKLSLSTRTKTRKLVDDAENIILEKAGEAVGEIKEKIDGRRNSKRRKALAEAELAEDEADAGMTDDINKVED